MKIKELTKIIDENQEVKIIEKCDRTWQIIHTVRNIYEINAKYGEMEIKKIRPRIGNALEIEIKDIE